MFYNRVPITSKNFITMDYVYPYIIAHQSVNFTFNNHSKRFTFNNSYNYYYCLENFQGHSLSGLSSRCDNKSWTIFVILLRITHSNLLGIAPNVVMI